MAIKTYELCKEYKDVKAVDRLTLEIRENEIFALLGVNGAGKTTTVKMLSCLTRATSGDAEVMGYSVTKEPEKVKSVIDISMQETAIGRNLTVMENLKFYAKIRGLDETAAKERIDEMINAFGFEKVLKKRGKTLSGGWQRVLFLDEPTLGLDVLARHELWDMIRRLRGGTTVVLTTHYMEEAEKLSDRIGIMKEGRLIAVGTAESFIQNTGCANFEDAFIATVTEGGLK